ncbi:MAG: phytanoyl-CoA dioxygenase family protein [Planctomycetes bacterium]|nr:phytanoyl-CoA dioxygenase family protein [Planctomycetota bacterium]
MYETSSPTKTATSEHPTAAERFFFDNNGYLVLPSFLAPDHARVLLEALDRAIARRRDPSYRREHPTAFKDRLEGPNYRIFHLLDDDPLFLDLLDYAPMMAYVRGLFNDMPHIHGCDAIYEVTSANHHGLGWHIDGIQNGFRNLKPHIPFLQFKIGYYLSDMSEPNQGNLTLVPGSHKALFEPDSKDLKNPGLFPGAVQVCGGPGTAFFFHNAVWHTGGPWTRPDGKRIVLYYAFEHPWMLACAEQWRYPKGFYASLSSERRKLFHGFVFDPPEYRWG